MIKKKYFSTFKTYSHLLSFSLITCRHFGVQDPSWAELHHFISFLNQQLGNFEESVYCSDATATDLPGFRAFVLQFMLQMSKVCTTIYIFCVSQMLDLVHIILCLCIGLCIPNTEYVRGDPRSADTRRSCPEPSCPGPGNARSRCC